MAAGHLSECKMHLPRYAHAHKLGDAQEPCFCPCIHNLQYITCPPRSHRQPHPFIHPRTTAGQLPHQSGTRPPLRFLPPHFSASGSAPIRFQQQLEMGITWLQMEESMARALIACHCWPFPKANGEMRQSCRRLTLRELRGLPILSDLPTGDVFWYEMPHPMPNCKFSDCIWVRGSWALSGFASSDFGPIERRIAILDTYDKLKADKRLIDYINGEQFLTLFKEIVSSSI